MKRAVIHNEAVRFSQSMAEVPLRDFNSPIMSTAAGFHNDTLDLSTARIIEGATWKRQRIVVLLPAARMIESTVFMTFWHLIFPPNNASHKILCQGMEVGDAYSRAIECVLGHPDLSTWEYFLTIEHDNTPPADGIVNLIKSMDQHPEYAAISGLYWTKGEGGVPQIWGDPTDPIPNARPQPPRPRCVQECCGIGMGFALWRMSMFKDERLRKPWFKTVASLQEGVGTQDLYFCGDARKHGYRFAVDTNVKVGHYDASTGRIW
jgi:hypothetical protein